MGDPNQNFLRLSAIEEDRQLGIHPEAFAVRYLSPPEHRVHHMVPDGEEAVYRLGEVVGITRFLREFISNRVDVAS